MSTNPDTVADLLGRLVEVGERIAAVLEKSAALVVLDEPESAHIENPIARTISELVTPKQLVAIRAIANAAGVDAERRSLDIFGCKPEELTKRAASRLIDELKDTSWRDENPRRAS